MRRCIFREVPGLKPLTQEMLTYVFLHTYHLAPCELDQNSKLWPRALAHPNAPGPPRGRASLLFRATISIRSTYYGSTTRRAARTESVRQTTRKKTSETACAAARARARPLPLVALTSLVRARRMRLALLYRYVPVRPRCLFTGTYRYRTGKLLSN